MEGDGVGLGDKKWRAREETGGDGPVYLGWRVFADARARASWKRERGSAGTNSSTVSESVGSLAIAGAT